MSFGDIDPLKDADGIGKLSSASNTERDIANTIFDLLTQGKFEKLEDRLSLETLERRGYDPRAKYDEIRDLRDILVKVLENDELFQDHINIWISKDRMNGTLVVFQNMEVVKGLLKQREVELLVRETAVRFGVIVVDFLGIEAKKARLIADPSDLMFSFYKKFGSLIVDSPLVKETLSILDVIEFLGDVVHGRVENFRSKIAEARFVLELLAEKSNSEEVKEAARAELENRRPIRITELGPPRYHRLKPPFEIEPERSGCRTRENNRGKMRFF